MRQSDNRPLWAAIAVCLIALLIALLWPFAARAYSGRWHYSVTYEAVIDHTYCDTTDQRFKVRLFADPFYSGASVIICAAVTDFRDVPAGYGVNGLFGTMNDKTDAVQVMQMPAGCWVELWTDAGYSGFGYTTSSSVKETSARWGSRAHDSFSSIRRACA